MKLTLLSRRAFSIIILAVLVLDAAAFPVVRADTSESVVYLKAHSENPWVTMVLAAAGEKPDVTYLKNASGTKAIDLETPILALTAAGEDPRMFPAINLVATLETFHREGQIGD